MTPPAKLKEIVDGMDFQNEEMSAYWNKKTGEVVTLTSDSIRAAEEKEPLENYPEWEYEEILEAGRFLESPDDYLPLPSKFEIHEWEIMERFCLSLKDGGIRDQMLDTIRGTGAFRRFKDNLERFDLEERWYPFREQALKEIAVDWCQRNGIDLIRG